MVTRPKKPSLIILAAAVLLAPFQIDAQVTDPVPSIEWSDLTINITEFSQVPASSGSRPRARINHLKPAGDGSGRLFVNDLRGKMYLVSEGSASVYLDLEAEVGSAFKDSPGLGTGFTSIAFHPQFATNGKLYTAHSENPGTAPADFTLPNPADSVALQGVITEWTASNPAANVFSGTRREILRVDISGTIHGMQEISFNPNPQPGEADFGMLYICIGDGGSTIGGFPENTSRLDSVQGTILRIDPLGTNSPNGAYGIPADNPWASDEDPNTFAEIWAYGFRNPHRISWDTGGDGKMLEGEIGERNIEEVNLIEPGRHYGWNEREGTYRINPNFVKDPGSGTNDEIFPLPPDDATLGFTYPVAQYDHEDGRALVGGYVYRGSALPDLVGEYLFGDVVSGRLFIVDADSLTLGTQTPIQEVHLKLDGVSTTMLSIVQDSRTDIRFGYDEDGELYITEKRHGKIYKIIGAQRPPTLPSFTGLVNISTRGLVGTDSEVMIAGFVSDGTAESGSVLVRGVGPTLAGLGVTNTIEDPVIRVFRSNPDGSSTEIAMNDDWGDDSDIALAAEAVGAFALDLGSKDAALIVSDLPAGAYTVQLSGKSGTEQNGLIEIYRMR